MRIKSNRLLAAAVVGLLAGSTSAFATNGSFMIGSGAGSIGMGGVGVTSPQDSMCVGGNPACLGEFERPQFDIGAGLFRPVRSGALDFGLNPDGTRRSDMGTAGGEYQASEVNLYLLPSMGFVWPFDDQLTVGFAALPAGGGGVTFKPNFYNGSNYLGTDLVQLIVPITVAYKLNETNTVGASIVPARQRFLAQGLEEFKPFSSDRDHFTNNGHDFANGLGMRLGWMGYYFDKRMTLGATYASKVFMEKFEHYKGLFAENGSFDIPANYAVGIGIKPIENLTVALDIERIMYSGVPAFANRGPDQTNLNLADPHQLGMEQGAGFGWQSQTYYKLGVAYKPNENWILRAGYNYGKMPIAEDQLLFSLLATATTERHYTAGFTYNLGEQSILGFGSEGAVTFAWMYAPNTVIEGQTVGLGGVTGMAGMQMRQQSWDLAYTLKF